MAILSPLPSKLQASSLASLGSKLGVRSCINAFHFQDSPTSNTALVIAMTCTMKNNWQSMARNQMNEQYEDLPPYRSPSTYQRLLVLDAIRSSMNSTKGGTQGMWSLGTTRQSVNDTRSAPAPFRFMASSVRTELA